MEKKTILMKSNVAASNLLRTLHSLYRFGHFCDVTIHTEQLGIQEEFYVHKVVLAASSNYFKSLFLSDEMLNTRHCRVTLQDIHAEEFVSFLKFVYTTEVEIEVDRLPRFKEVAKILECKDLLDILKGIKAVDENLEMNVRLNKNEQTEETGGKKQCDLPQVLAAPVKKNLWNRLKHSKLRFDVIESKPVNPHEDRVADDISKEESAVTGGYNKQDIQEMYNPEENNQEENKTECSLPEEKDLKEAHIALSRMSHRKKDESSSLTLCRANLRKSTSDPPKVMPRPHASNKCNYSFHFAKQNQSHMDQDHGSSLRIEYRCNICDQLFLNGQNLRQHKLTVHSGEQGFPCVLCDKKFKCQKDISGHVRRAHGRKQDPQLCPYCDKVISSKCGLRVHIRTHTGEKPYKCECCHASFAQRSAFNTHVRKTHEHRRDGKHRPSYWTIFPSAVIGSRMIKNKDTGQKISNTDMQREPVGNMVQELERKPSTSLRMEAQCDRSNSKRGETSGQETVEVEKCVEGEGSCEAGYSHKDKEGLSSDKNKNEGSSEQKTEVPKLNIDGKGITMEVTPKPAYIITCTKCTETFTSQSKYASHCKEVHRSMPGKVYQCDVCSKSFASYNSWKEHRTCVHTADRQFACSLCQATFKRKRDVRTHYMRTHEGRVKRPLCSVCGKILSSRTALVFHMRTHTGEKPYQCSVCCSKFAQPSQLKIHTRSSSTTLSLPTI